MTPFSPRRHDVRRACYRLCLVLLVLVVAGCQTLSINHRPVGGAQQTLSYQCGGTLLTATFNEPDALTIQTDEKIYHLTGRFSASGAHFTSIDQSPLHSVFEAQGNEAIFTVANQAPLSCVILPSGS